MQIKAFLEDNFDVTIDSMETHLLEVPRFDSLSLIELMALLEQHGATISLDDVMAAENLQVLETKINASL
ncbi:Uncharacterised protein [Listeria grayi]|uniref:Carrier domain-containing protein n=3 Tax=Listeria grayi TaxID=1641 RepID=D7UVL3_LISGR|nr:phosphopantetheine-binding protein [Listeria grayi]EFI84694.1 hypothetical protein HMPREF0556_11247 [Listeria grayi DSM 20601]EUJ26974.1 hypothetical protein LMUR_10712 [Listeria grayi FSL F6-1183]MBC1922487.1 hypothetical protein [Listeria grayi]STY42923.1 Uncharacterised protein [Listeria grayi]VEI33295.1 Uncharacterised protein [Listeria grayi]